MNFSIIQKLELESANRADSEYFTVNNLFKEYYLGSEVTDFVQYGTSDDLNEDKIGYPTLRLNEVEDFFIKEPEKYCSTLTQSQFQNLQLKKGDLLICRTNGNPSLVGKSALVITNEPYAFASYLFRIRTDLKKINPETLLAYLHSSYGRAEIEKNQMISNQTNFSPARFKLIRVPKFNTYFQTDMGQLINESFNLQNTSKQLYSSAEDLLLEELGLKDFKIPEDLSYIVNYSELENINRVDADYFQPKYQIISERIKISNAKLLGNLVTLKKGFEPGSEAYEEEGKLFIRVSSLSKNGIESKDQKYLSDELYQKLKPNFEPKVGEILLTKDATPGISYVVKEPTEGIISGGILRLKLKRDIEPEYLSLCISSQIGQMQADRDAGGSIIVHWKPEQIKNILIPVLPKETQTKIADLVKKSHGARKKSKELLEEAKRKVEEMIEMNIQK